MNITQVFPAFDDCFPDLNQFLAGLVRSYEAGEIHSWDRLEEKTNAFFTSQRRAEMESLLPGWEKMASYSEGITLVHVTCVFLGLLMLPEYQTLTPQEKQLAKWIVIFHDIAKAHIRGKKDTMHAFRSGVQTANLLRKFGFPATQRYDELIHSWSEYTYQALFGDEESAPTPDNRKLLEILAGIDQLYGIDTPATLIVKTVLLHISLDVDPFYPTPAPLTEEEIERCISPSLFPLLRVMMLADNEGWSLFDPETRARQRNDTLKAFETFERMVFD
jgi:hypothetical protein